MRCVLLKKEYNRAHAVTYAQTWALGRNPLFTDFTDGGGNCTNFVSQCILAGCCEMNYTPTYGWYYLSSACRAPAWAGVVPFYHFMTGKEEFRQENGGVGPYATDVPQGAVVPGDVIQLGNEKGQYYHTLFVSDVIGARILVCAHSNDALNRDLSTYRYAMLRCLHIEGIRVEAAEDYCFERLLAGERPPEEPR